YMSAIYAKKQSYIDVFNRGVLPCLFFSALVCFLFAIQPDTGTAFIIFLVGCCIIITSGMRLRTIMKLIGIGMGTIIGLTPILFDRTSSVWNEIVCPTKVASITSFINTFEYEDK
ncbi:FtsW/RodA/SpoVE family cell cycle protein, partial [Listeria monocytogenes]|uniref:FtsW/RodA/SpoVE family cell cycle protein n=1 Tax=Listeria monocytogenes TaxID=1639 RepID=UPI000A40E783